MYCSDKLQPETKQVFNIIIISTIYNLACMPAIFSYRQHAAETLSLYLLDFTGLVSQCPVSNHQVAMI